MVLLAPLLSRSIQTSREKEEKMMKDGEKITYMEEVVQQQNDVSIWFLLYFCFL